MNDSNATIINEAKFAQIEIQKIAPGGWTEKAQGNNFIIKTANANIEVVEGASVQFIALEEITDVSVSAASGIKITANGNVPSISVRKASAKLSIDGVCDNFGINIDIRNDDMENGKFELTSSIKASIYMQTFLDTVINLNGNAGKSDISVNWASKAGADVTVYNNTSDEVHVSNIGREFSSPLEPGKHLTTQVVESLAEAIGLLLTDEVIKGSNDNLFSVTSALNLITDVTKIPGCPETVTGGTITWRVEGGDDDFAINIADGSVKQQNKNGQIGLWAEIELNDEDKTFKHFNIMIPAINNPLIPSTISFDVTKKDSGEVHLTLIGIKNEGITFDLSRFTFAFSDNTSDIAPAAGYFSDSPEQPLTGDTVRIWVNAGEGTYLYYDMVFGDGSVTDGELVMGKAPVS